MKTDEKCMSIKFKGGGEFINPPSPEKVLTPKIVMNLIDWINQQE